MNTQTLFKKVRIALLASAILLGCQLSGFSQIGRINAGVELGIPLGNFSNYAGVGGGISAKYEAAIPTVKNLNWTAGLGYLAFAGKNNDAANGYKVHYSITPVQGGIKYYLNERYQGFYGSAELGFSVLSAHVTYNGNNNAFYGQGSSTYISFAPGVGYQYGPLDFSGRFQLVSNASYFSLRAAYVFDLSR